MSEKKRLPELLMLPGEVEFGKRLFDDKPVRAIEKYLECFDEDGCQVLDVPRFVLEFLAQKFFRFMRSDFRSLDNAFGGQVARQRQALESEDMGYGIIFDYLCEHEETKRIDKNDRTSTPSELAYERVADRYNTSVDNVRRILKKSKSR